MKKKKKKEKHTHTYKLLTIKNMITKTLSLKEQIQNRSKIDQIVRRHDLTKAT